MLLGLDCFTSLERYQLYKMSENEDTDGLAQNHTDSQETSPTAMAKAQLLILGSERQDIA